MSFFFPEVRFNKVNESITMLDYLGSNQVNQLNGSSHYIRISFTERYYHAQSQRYFGMGWVLSFIPMKNNKFYQARKQFNHAIDEFNSFYVRGSLKTINNSMGASESYRLNIMAKASLWANSGSFYFLSALFLALRETIDFSITDIKCNDKLSIIELIRNFSFLRDILQLSYDAHTNTVNGTGMRPNAIKNALHTLINPGRLLGQLLIFTKNVVFRILEIGSTRHHFSHPIRQLLKGMVSCVFIPLRLIANILEFAIDLALSAIKTFVILPIVFMASAAKESYDSIGKTYINVTADEILTARQFRKAVKQKSDSSSMDGCNGLAVNGKNTEYLAVQKHRLYGSSYHEGSYPYIAKDQLILLRAPKQRAKEWQQYIEHSKNSKYDLNKLSQDDITEIRESIPSLQTT